MRLFKKIISAILLLLIACINHETAAQNFIPDAKRNTIVCGFDKAIEGEVLPYFSCYEDYATEALLTRCTDGKKIIEWQTAVVPEKIKGDYVYFNWVAAHSTGTSKGERQFDLFINDKLALTFTTYPQRYDKQWSFAAADSTRLTFEFKTKDRYTDAHGIAWLRIPARMTEAGKPVKLKVVGHNQNSPDWFMTFKFRFEEQMQAELLPFILRSEDAEKKQPLHITILHFGLPDKALVTIRNYKNEMRDFRFDIKEGVNVFTIPVACSKEEHHLYVTGKTGKQQLLDAAIHQKPVTQRNFYFIHHSHNDIGYSHLQTEVEKIQNQNISDALRMIEKTKGYSAQSQFRWNIESLWALDNFLQQADEQTKTEFVNAVNNHRIGLSAFYANILTGLTTAEECKWIMEYAQRIKKEMNFKIDAAMFSDIPGMSWSMVDAMAESGVRYLSIGENYMEGLPDNGDRIGLSQKALGDKPFWWKSTTGTDSVLVWMGAKGYSSWHRFDKGKIFVNGYRKIAAYVNELDSSNYPYDMVQWRYNIISDNGPIDSTISDFVKQWNEKYEAPTLQLAEVSEMFHRFDSLYGKQIPSRSGDFTPYWEDGAYSTAYEEAENRRVSRRISQLEKLSGDCLPCNDMLYRARRCVVMFHEHTWGSWCSTTQPDDAFTVDQWKYKKMFVDSALYYVNTVENILKDIQNENKYAITVFNTLDFVRSGYVEVNAYGALKGNCLKDENGKFIPVQKFENGYIGFIADSIPANGFRNYSLTEIQIKLNMNDSLPFSFMLDSASGCISQLNYMNQNLIDHSKFKGLIQPIYVAGLDVSKYVTGKAIHIEQVEFGPVVKSYRIVSLLEGCDSIVSVISTYARQPYLHVKVSIAKKAIREKEGVHIAMPFSIKNPELQIGFRNKFMNPSINQLPGSNKDYFSVENVIAIKGTDYSVVVANPQGALFEVGSLTNEERVNNGYKLWKTTYSPSATLFSYVMNNYWHTNYKADQSGTTTFDYFILPQKQFDNEAAYKFGMGCNFPLIAY